jgi:hypothetical protein
MDLKHKIVEAANGEEALTVLKVKNHSRYYNLRFKYAKMELNF